MDETLIAVGAGLVGCAPCEVMAVGWQGERLAVVWGIGWKKTFARSEVDALPVRAQMVVTAPSNDTDGLHTLFPGRVAVALIRAGFETPGDVQRATDDRLRAVGGIGPRTLADIRELLPELGQVQDLPLQGGA